MPPGAPGNPAMFFTWNNMYCVYRTWGILLAASVRYFMIDAVMLLFWMEVSSHHGEIRPSSPINLHYSDSDKE